MNWMCAVSMLSIALWCNFVPRVYLIAVLYHVIVWLQWPNCTVWFCDHIDLTDGDWQWLYKHLAAQRNKSEIRLYHPQSIQTSAKIMLKKWRTS